MNCYKTSSLVDNGRGFETPKVGVRAVGDWDTRGQDVDQRFARFGRAPLTDEDVWALGMAAMVMPDGNPGAEAYLAKVAGISVFAGRLTTWGRVVAIGIAQGGYRGRDGRRRRAYVEGYSETWGRYAVADGLTLALYGQAAMSASDRVAALGCGRQAYGRIRDFVGGALVQAISEFRHALEWACGYRADRVLEGRWEGATSAKWSGSGSHANIGYQDRGAKYPLFAGGCSITPRAEEACSPDSDQPPETLYHGLRPTGWWDAAYARGLRKECPSVTIYPTTDPIPPSG